MADLGIARMGKEAGTACTLTRADLADVAHRSLSVPPPSLPCLERILHTGCHTLAEVKT